MKLIINVEYGGFGLSELAEKKLGLFETYYDADEIRTDEKLIALVEEDAEAMSGDYSELRVVEIPDTATDYYINEYDGLENVIYVVNGKLHWVS